MLLIRWYMTFILHSYIAFILDLQKLFMIIQHELAEHTMRLLSHISPWLACVQRLNWRLNFWGQYRKADLGFRDKRAQLTDHLRCKWCSPFSRVSSQSVEINLLHNSLLKITFLYLISQKLFLGLKKTDTTLLSSWGRSNTQLSFSELPSKLVRVDFLPLVSFSELHFYLQSWFWDKLKVRLTGWCTGHTDRLRTAVSLRAPVAYGQSGLGPVAPVTPWGGDGNVLRASCKGCIGWHGIGHSQLPAHHVGVRHGPVGITDAAPHPVSQHLDESSIGAGPVHQSH